MAQCIDELESVEAKNINRELPFWKRKCALFISLVIIIIIIVFLIIFVYLNLRFHITNKQFSYIDKIIDRDEWGGRPPLYEHPQNLPVKYVIISHSSGAECFDITTCSKQMMHFQNIHVEKGSPDIGYNFLIGGDTNIYVGRGWDNHNFHMNLDTIGICFIGNYIYNELTPGMIESTQQLLKMGIKEGKLDKDYILVAHNQTYNTVSPGPNVYKQIKFWPHFSPDILEDIEEDEKI